MSTARDAARAAKADLDAVKNTRRADADKVKRERDARWAPARARARRVLGLAAVILAVNHVARLARLTAEERAPFTHAVNIGGGPRTATLTLTVAPQAPASTAAAPTVLSSDWAALTAVTLDTGSRAAPRQLRRAPGGTCRVAGLIVALYDAQGLTNKPPTLPRCIQDNPIQSIGEPRGYSAISFQAKSNRTIQCEGFDVNSGAFQTHSFRLLKRSELVRANYCASVRSAPVRGAAACGCAAHASARPRAQRVRRAKRASVREAHSCARSALSVEGRLLGARTPHTPLKLEGFTLRYLLIPRQSNADKWTFYTHYV